MKAVVYRKYGSPDVLHLEEVGKPVPQDDDVLIKVIAVSINPADWHMIRGAPFFARLSFGLFKPKSIIPGIDIAGVVESVGKNVNEFKPGDEVFGDCGWGSGLAEYVCAKENQIVLKPHNITFEEAASVNVAGITALQGLRFDGKIKHGAQWPEGRNKILINGASGGVGTYAVQIAKSFSAEVTGICSGMNLEMVASIGADQVIDYTKEDFTNSGKKYDLILDVVGNLPVSTCKQLLSETGRCVVIGFTGIMRMLEHQIVGPFVSKSSGKNIGHMGTAQVNKVDLEFLSELLASGKIKPVIDKSYPMEKASEAIRYLETGRARGKVVVNIN